MTKSIKKLLSSASQQIDRLDAEVLLAHVLGQPREFLISHDTDTVGFLRTMKFKHLVKKRSQNFPAAQLIGTKGFFGYEFAVNQHTLIPRPDTELLVELALAEIKKSKNQITLIDVGTGSGCIPISIAKQTSDLGLKTSFYASDISPKTLKIAKKNAYKHNVQITFRQGNLLEPLYQELRTKNQEPLIITANLPYLTEHQFQTEASIKHEPKSALVADNNGLALYEEMLQQLVDCRLSSVVCFFEIDPTQSERMQSLVKKYFSDAKVEMKKDLAGLDRIVTITMLS